MTTALVSLRSHRLRIAVLLMLGIYCGVSMRMNLSMAIVCMVKHTPSPRHSSMLAAANGTSELRKGCVPQSAVEYKGTLDWEPEAQSMLFSATFYGSLLTTPFAGILADRFGPKLAFIFGMTPIVIGTFLSPLVASASYTGFWALRFAMGLGDGFMMPCVGSTIARWFPHSEKSTIAGLASSGFQLASLISALFSARLCKTQLGWPSIFVVFGSMGTVWIALWTLLGANSPSESRFTSHAEREHLAGRVASGGSKKARAPLRKLWLSPCTNSIFACYFAHNFSTGIMSALLPTYFKEYLFLPLDKVSTYTIVFFIGQLVAKYGGGMLADHLNNTNKLTFTNTAKLMQGFGGYLSLLSLIGLAYLPSCEQPWWALIFLAFFGLGSSATYSGFFTSLVSIAPPFSGTLTSISCVYANVGYLLGPMLVGGIGHFVGHGPQKWVTVFLLGGAAMGLSATAYLIWGSADVQEWGQLSASSKAVEDDDVVAGAYARFEEEEGKV